jgi:uncharacterized protein YegL
MDKMGIVSFSTSATTDRMLLSLDDINKALLKSTIDSIVANGSTAIGDGINNAVSELNSARASPNGYKFIILLSDGQNNAGANPITAANNAADNNVKIYTIGFGSDADTAMLQQIASITDANYYSANDKNVLEDVYALIAIDIGEILAQGHTRAYDANVLIPFSDCSFIIDTGGGECATISDANYLVYSIGYIDPYNTWRDHFILNIPCTSTYACSVSSMTFPSSGTEFFWKDSNGFTKPAIPWDVNKTITFKYRDLGISILSASINAFGEVTIDVNAKNLGRLDTPATDVKFFLGDYNSGTFLGAEPVSVLSPGEFRLLLNNRVDSLGWIYAVINKDFVIRECPGNNIASLNCSGSPKTYFVVIDAWAWEK